MRRAVVLVALAVLFSGGLEAQTKAISKGSPSKRAPDTKYAAALDALQDLDSAASVGLNARQFNERVITVKIKVDKLGNDPRYKLMKETTWLHVDASTLWNGSIAGSLPTGSLQRLQERNVNLPNSTKHFSQMQSDDPVEGLTKELWRLDAEAAYKVLWLTAQVAMEEVLGKAPKGSYTRVMAASKKAQKERELQRDREIERHRTEPLGPDPK